MGRVRTEGRGAHINGLLGKCGSRTTAEVSQLRSRGWNRMHIRLVWSRIYGALQVRPALLLATIALETSPRHAHHFLVANAKR
jgi:hypothetical protein